ncbi:MAG TPA: hypothetical protein VNL14_23555 [Candidatus Acidoferrales bacterium]|nr:hypothetical protein [Candidatus Acidoferrales bacterium]
MIERLDGEFDTPHYAFVENYHPPGFTLASALFTPATGDSPGLPSASAEAPAIRARKARRLQAVEDGFVSAVSAPFPSLLLPPPWLSVGLSIVNLASPVLKEQDYAARKQSCSNSRGERRQEELIVRGTAKENLNSAATCLHLR